MLTWNSFTASCENWYGARPEPVRPRAWPKNVLSLFAPSMTSEFSVPRWPAKLMSPRRTSFTTPGVVRTKSMKLRPLTGRFSIAVSFTTELTCVRSVSMSGAAAVTVMVSATPTRSVMSSVTSLPTLTDDVAADGLKSVERGRSRRSVPGGSRPTW